MNLLRKQINQNSPLQTILLNQVKEQNPAMINTLLDAQKKGISPQQLVKDMMIKASPEQAQQVISQVKSFGVPNNIIDELQNFK